MRRMLPVIVLLMLFSGCTVVHTTEGETSSYRFDSMSWLALGGGGLAIAAVGWFFQRSDDSDTGMGRARGWGAMVIGILMAICGVPAIATSRVTVTDTSMSLDDRLFWPIPSPKVFKYSELRSVEETEEQRWTRRGKRTTHYLVISKADGTTEKFQIGRLTREAYPEIIRRLEAQDFSADPPRVAAAGAVETDTVFDPADVGQAVPNNSPPPTPFPGQPQFQQPFAGTPAPAQPVPVAPTRSPGVPLKPGDQRGIDARVELAQGMRLEAEWGGRWLPVTVIQGGIGGDPKIHWDGWDENFDEVKPRADLRWPGGVIPPSLTAAAGEAAKAVAQASDAADRSPFRKKAAGGETPEDSSPPAQGESPFRPKAAESAKPADSTASSPFRPKAPQASADEGSTPAETKDSPFRPKSPSKPAGDEAESNDGSASPFRKKSGPTNATDRQRESPAEADDTTDSGSPFRKKPTDKAGVKGKTSGKPDSTAGKAPESSDSKPAVDPMPDSEPAADDSRLITAKTPLTKGQKLEGEWGSTWEPVTVLEVKNGGMVKVHWDGRPAAFDKVIPRSRLRLPAADSKK